MTTECRKQYLQDRLVQLQKSHETTPSLWTWNAMHAIAGEILALDPLAWHKKK